MINRMVPGTDRTYFILASFQKVYMVFVHESDLMPFKVLSSFATDNHMTEKTEMIRERPLIVYIILV